MAAYDTLRAAIDNYIKANGNKEITGTVLNDILNAMVSALGADTRFAGVAVPTTNPGNPEGNVVYFASQAGTYSNFGCIVLPLGIHILVWNGTAWTSQTWFSVDNTPTQNSQNLATSGGILQAIVDAVGVERLRAIGAEVTSCSFDGTTKKISFFNSADDTLFQLDATAFVTDGMVSDVKIEDGNLVIQFNTDAGKQDIEIPLTEIFNPSNYYTKTAIDELLALYYTKTETNALLTAINNKFADGCLYRGMAEPTTNPPTPTTKVFYIATKAGTYTNFGNIAVTEGITILKYDGSNWSKEQISYSDGVFDISAYHATGGTLATYADLSAALDSNNGGGVPQSLQKGGMSVKFVQSSDNKYVQFMCKSSTWSTTPADWEKINNVSVSQNTSTGHIDISVGDLDNSSTSVEEVYGLNYNLPIGTTGGYKLQKNVIPDNTYVIVVNSLGGLTAQNNFFLRFSNNDVEVQRYSFVSAGVFEIELNSEATEVQVRLPDVAELTEALDVQIYSKKSIGSKIVELEDITKEDSPEIKELNTEVYQQASYIVQAGTASGFQQEITLKEPCKNLDLDVVSLGGLSGNTNFYINFIDKDGVVIRPLHLVNIGWTSVTAARDVYAVQVRTHAETTSNLVINLFSHDSLNKRVYCIEGDVLEDSTEIKKLATYTIPANSSASYKPEIDVDFPTTFYVQIVSWGGLYYFGYAKQIHYWRFLDENDTLIQEIRFNDGINKITLPTKVKKMQARTYAETTSEFKAIFYQDSIRYDVEQTKYYNRLKDRTIVMLGDSITEIPHSLGRTFPNGIVEFFHQYTGANVIRGSFGGAHLSRRLKNVPQTVTSVSELMALLDIPSVADALATGDWSKQAAGVESEYSDDASYATIVAEMSQVDIQNVDIITIFAGTNDMNSSVALGEQGDTTPYNNIYGAIYYIINTLLTANPNLSIFIFTPCYRKFGADWSDESGWCDVYTNSRNLKLADYCEAIEGAAKLHHIPVCNMLDEMGWNKYNYRNFCNGSDGTHPVFGFHHLAEKEVAFILSHLNRGHKLVYSKTE